MLGHMPQSSFFALVLMSMLATTGARATESEVPTPPAPDFQPVLYQPWRPGEPLPPAREPAETPPARLVPGPDYARRPYHAAAGVAALPFECLASRRACGSSAQFVRLAWRTTPHFAWALAGERTGLTTGDRYYLALGAKVFAYEHGVLDPFLELTLGGEASTETEGVALAEEVVFGVGVLVVEHLVLAPTLAFRHSEHRIGVCRSTLAACDPWSHDRTYWIALGLSVGGVWGSPH